MQTDKFTIPYRIATIKNLEAQQQQLLEAALRGTEKAYAPYSSFLVGAAVLMEDGTIYSSGNFENASYPLSLCAERMVVATAISTQPNQKIVAMAITAKNPEKTIAIPIPPCGACRQVLTEVENKQSTPIELILCGASGDVYIFENAKQLLPFSFGGQFL